ncbi:MAG: hypothetical protein KGL43_18620 [Burkholderiales bacterium]|nr:hypothetical protein [Burkholderiales bacterium]
MAHPEVAEAAVVGFAHPLKGQGLHAYVTLEASVAPGDGLRRTLVPWMRDAIGAIAAPDRIQRAAGLPKTRSGKIMRRVLRRIAEGETADLGDTTTLADATMIESLIEGRRALAGEAA